jgi:hypothetical protein
MYTGDELVCDIFFHYKVVVLLTAMICKVLDSTERADDQAFTSLPRHNII